jgi:hypothetical protein
MYTLCVLRMHARICIYIYIIFNLCTRVRVCGVCVKCVCVCVCFAWVSGPFQVIVSASMYIHVYAVCTPTMWEFVYQYAHTSHVYCVKSAGFENLSHVFAWPYTYNMYARIQIRTRTLSTRIRTRTCTSCTHVFEHAHVHHVRTYSNTHTYIMYTRKTHASRHRPCPGSCS